MGTAAAEITADDVESLMHWWREAGVDTAIAEEPTRWLVKEPPPPKPVIIEPAPERLPLELTTFLDWLMTADLPEAGRRRVRPVEQQPGSLMIVTDMPELADLDAGQLLGGEVAEMFDKMLASIGRSRADVTLASLNPGRPPSGRIADAHLERLAGVMRHHVRLAAPAQLWLMGSAASRALLGIDDRAAAGRLHEINLEGVTIKAIATAHPRRLSNKDQKRRAWEEMQRLTAGTDG